MWLRQRSKRTRGVGERSRVRVGDDFGVRGSVGCIRDKSMSHHPPPIGEKAKDVNKAEWMQLSQAYPHPIPSG